MQSVFVKVARIITIKDQVCVGALPDALTGIDQLRLCQPNDLLLGFVPLGNVEISRCRDVYRARDPSLAVNAALKIPRTAEVKIPSFAAQPTVWM